MSNDNKIRSIDEIRVRKLDHKNYWSVLEEFECLKVKIMIDKEFTQGEAHRFITLLKYLKDKGHSESFKMFCSSLHKKLQRGEPIA